MQRKRKLPQENSGLAKLRRRDNESSVDTIVKNREHNSIQPFVSLPLELHFYIFSMMCLIDIINTGKTSHELCSSAMNESVWKRQLRLLFTRQPDDMKKKSELYRDTFFRVMSQKTGHAFVVYDSPYQTIYDPLTYFNNDLIGKIEKIKVFRPCMEQIEQQCKSKNIRHPRYILEFDISVISAEKLCNEKHCDKLIQHIIKIHPDITTKSSYRNANTLFVKFEDDQLINLNSLIYSKG